MTIYKITGTLNEPRYNHMKPYFMHHESTILKLKSRLHSVGDRKISVTTEDKKVAEMLSSVFVSVFDEVHQEEIEK